MRIIQLAASDPPDLRIRSGYEIPGKHPERDYPRSKATRRVVGRKSGLREPGLEKIEAGHVPCLRDIPSNFGAARILGPGRPIGDASRVSRSEEKSGSCSKRGFARTTVKSALSPGMDGQLPPSSWPRRVYGYRRKFISLTFEVVLEVAAVLCGGEDERKIVLCSSLETLARHTHSVADGILVIVTGNFMAGSVHKAPGVCIATSNPGPLRWSWGGL
ncbi:hypothetical protein KM043_005245 [Ampulex compressa]|nr:hypothetical protein KM043_005245 [Ampulex compressa]